MLATAWERLGMLLSAPHLQEELCKLRDCTRLRTLEPTLRGQCNWAQLERLKDLRHPQVSHKWLWHMDSRRGSVMTACDYVIGAQLRLGARIHEGNTQCRLCGVAMDPQLVHSECCEAAGAKGDTTQWSGRCWQ